jgi:DNA-binding response OmpR family regulator
MRPSSDLEEETAAVQPRPEVVVVDDESDAAREMAACLSNAGLSCIPVSRPWEAFRLLAEEGRPHVAVIDIRMPELSGLQLVERLNAVNRPDRAEVILVSGNAVFDDAVAAIRLGVRRLICKPLDLAELVREVKTARIEYDLRTGRVQSSAQRGGGVAPSSIDTLVAQSRWRERFFPKDLLSDRCWRMLLELYRARIQGRQTSLTSLGLVSGLSMATALRKIHTMHETSLVTYSDDPADKRRKFVSLSDMGLERMENFLARLDADLNERKSTTLTSRQ